jgi:hypothetical protein
MREERQLELSQTHHRRKEQNLKIRQKSLPLKRTEIVA